MYETDEHCFFVDPKGHNWRSPYRTHNNWDYLQIEVFKVNPQRNRDIVVPTVCGISNQNIFGHISITCYKEWQKKDPQRVYQ